MKLNALARVASAAIVAAALASTTINPVANAADSDDAAATSADAATAGALPDPSFGPSARSSAIAAAQKDADDVATALHLTAGSALQVKDVVKDESGEVHIRYTRTYRGLPVVGGDIVVHDAATDAAATDVTWDKGGNFTAIATTAALSPAQASAAAGTGAESSELVVWAASGKPRMAYRTTVAKDQGLHQVVVTDANSGEQIVTYDLDQTTDAVGTGKTLYSGNVQIHTDLVGGSYAMRDLTRGSHRVTSMNNTTTTESAALTDADNIWGNNSESSAQSAAADAQYGAAVTWDFYKSLGRSGIRNDGVGARSRVHYGVNYDNAFWSDACFCMTYGDGNQFQPLVEIDVAGHEMSHGVTSNTAGLNYFGESGALNEATSDIFGAAVEFYANNATDRGDYYIGEEIASTFPGGALRRMDTPSLDGASDDCYAPLMGRDDVHYTSGVANHFFYLLSEGSGNKTIGGRAHTSAVCAGAAVTGITRAVAAKIWYRALTVYMVPGTDYRGARDATIRAAADLYGTSSATCAAVVKTWNAVKVPVGTFTCSGEIAPGTGSNVVRNPSFEVLPAGDKWTTASTTSSGAAFIGAFGVARTGRYSAYLRGYGSTGTDTLSQRVTVPTAGTPKLVYYLLVDSADSPTTAYDSFRVQVVNGTTTTTVQTSNNTKWDASYHRMTVSLAAYKGKTITLKFIGTEDSSRQTGFVVDDVSIRSY